MSLTLPVSLCVYNDITQTVYPVTTGFPPEETYLRLKNAFIVGIRNKKQKIIGAGIFITTLEENGDDLRDAAAAVFRKHKATGELMRKASSFPTGKLRFNLEKATLKMAFAEEELNHVYADFYMGNIIHGNA